MGSVTGDIYAGTDVVALRFGGGLESPVDGFGRKYLPQHLIPQKSDSCCAVGISKVRMCIVDSGIDDSHKNTLPGQTVGEKGLGTIDAGDLSAVVGLKEKALRFFDIDHLGVGGKHKYVLFASSCNPVSAY